jgi:hypothetical protein
VFIVARYRPTPLPGPVRPYWPRSHAIATSPFVAPPRVTGCTPNPPQTPAAAALTYYKHLGVRVYRWKHAKSGSGTIRTQLCGRQQENAHCDSPALDEAELYYDFSPPASEPRMDHTNIQITISRRRALARKCHQLTTGRWRQPRSGSRATQHLANPGSRQK